MVGDSGGDPTNSFRYLDAILPGISTVVRLGLFRLKSVIRKVSVVKTYYLKNRNVPAHFDA